MSNFLTNSLSILVGKSPTKLSLRNGIELYAPENHPLVEMVSDIFVQHVYTPNNLLIESNDVVIDIGANIGIFSLMAAMNSNNQIYAFEPMAENIKYLRKNLITNDLSNVIIVESAITDQIGFTNLYISNNPAGHMLFSDDTNNRKTDYVKVKTTTMQDIFDSFNLERVDFLKMDCEGSEGFILTSTSEKYLRRIRKIAIEFHDNVSILHHSQIKELLENHGFAVDLSWEGKGPFGYLYAHTLSH